MKLISMTDFVLEQETKYSHVTRDATKNPFLLIVYYAKFLKQPLKLSMFVPADENGNILTEPEDFEYYLSDNEQYFNGDIEESVGYANALEKVLFKGCEVRKIQRSHKYDTDYYVVFFNSKQLWISWTNREIEDYTIFDLELTESALKQIGLNP